MTGLNRVTRCSQKVQERPKSEVTLKALINKTTYQCEPEAPAGVHLLQPGSSIRLPDFATTAGFLVWCADTQQTWYVESKQHLDAGFIYRDDLIIYPCDDLSDAQATARNLNRDVDPNGMVRKSCYIMDDPIAGSYEVYYDPNYPLKHYGKSTPTGRNIWKYKNRWERDLDILELDAHYSEESKQEAKELIHNVLKDEDAIIISDGAWNLGVSAYSYVYIDSTRFSRVSEGCTPSSETQAVLIAEISGAYEALQRCILYGKTNVKYYYDNAQVLNTISSKRCAAVKEVQQYRELCEKFQEIGGTITYIQIHPKTGEDRGDMNRAVKYFHTLCDKECRVTADICSRDYIAVLLEPVVLPQKKTKGGNNNARKDASQKAHTGALRPSGRTT